MIRCVYGLCCLRSTGGGVLQDLLLTRVARGDEEDVETFRGEGVTATGADNRRGGVEARAPLAFAVGNGGGSR